MTTTPPDEHDATTKDGPVRAGLSIADLDRWYPPCGPCAFCGFHDKRHRVWDVWLAQTDGGTTAAEIAADFDEPVGD